MTHVFKRVIGYLSGALGLIMCLTTGAQACSSPLSPLANIVVSGTLDELIEALTAEADVDESNDFGINLLMLATFDEVQGAAKAEILLKAGAYPHGRAAEGTTALHFAAGQNDVKFVSLLLDYGVYVDVEDDFQTTPLMVASRSGDGSTEIVRLLLEVEAGPNLKDEFGRTALHLAAAAGRADAVELLLRAGAELEPRERDGLTPLMWAARRAPGTEAAEILLLAGADPGLRSEKGLTALDYAGQNKTPAADDLKKLLTEVASPGAALRRKAAARVSIEKFEAICNSGSAEELAQALEAGVKIDSLKYLDGAAYLYGAMLPVVADGRQEAAAAKAALLLAAGAAPDFKDDSENTALHYAPCSSKPGEGG